MPRYRFNWTNLDRRLLRDLTDALRLSGEPAEALRAAYGARPRPDFVRDAWPVLLGTWLAGDPPAAERVASSLRLRGVGNGHERDDLRFLASVRNTSGMRQVVLEAFIERGEISPEDRALARDLSASMPPALVAMPVSVVTPVPPPSTSTALTPVEEDDDLEEDGDLESLDGLEVDEPDDDSDLPETLRLMLFLAGALAENLEIPIEFDRDGDLAIPSGSAIVYVSVVPEPLLIRVFSPVVIEVRETTELLALLNSLNRIIPFGRFLHANEVVLLEHNLLPHGLSADEVTIIVNAIRTTADRFDHQIRERFGGRTAQLERAEDEIDV